MSVARREHPSRMLKKARLLTRPTLAATSPARPESAKTASSPRDAPCPKQGHLYACGHAQAGRERQGESYYVSYVEPLSEARTTLADFFSILLGVAAGSIVRTKALTDFFTIWH
jgi:hypothetical protein